MVYTSAKTVRCKYFDVDTNDFVIVDGVQYKGTPCLYELIFKRIPDHTIYTEDNKLAYKSILLARMLIDIMRIIQYWVTMDTDIRI